MRGIRRGLVERHVDHLFNLLGRQRLAAGRPRGVFQKAINTLAHKSSAPAPDREHTLAHGRGNLDGLQPSRSSQNDPRSPDHLLWRVAVSDETLQPFTISIANRYASAKRPPPWPDQPIPLPPQIDRELVERLKEIARRHVAERRDEIRACLA
jgi:hypothetical protein